MNLKKNVIANYIGNIMGLLINFLLVPVYLQFLSEEEYGLITFFTTLTSVFILLEMGLGLTVNKEIAYALGKKSDKLQIANTIKTFESVYWGVAFIIGVIVLSTSSIIATYWLNVKGVSINVLKQSVFLMGLALVFRWPLSFYNNVLSGFQKMTTLNIIKCIILLVQITGVYVTFKYFNFTIVEFFYFLIALYFLNVLILFLNIWGKDKYLFFKATFNFSLLKKVKKYLIGIGLFSIIGTIYVSIDKIIISSFFNLSILGQYSIISLLSLSSLQLVYPISSALFPKFVEYYSQEKKTEALLIFRKGYQLIFTLVFTFATIVFLFKKTILLLWTQNNIMTEKSIVYVDPLILGTVFYTMHILIVSIYTSLGVTKIINKMYVGVFITYLLMLLFSAKFNSIIMFSYSWLIANFILFIISFFLGRKILGKEDFSIFMKKDFLYPFILLILFFLISKFLNIDSTNFLTIVIMVITVPLLLILFSIKSFYIKNSILNFLKN